jgi:ABC-type glycerol-3-phosphate transport system substrate-binding protein
LVLREESRWVQWWVMTTMLAAGLLLAACAPLGPAMRSRATAAPVSSAESGRILPLLPTVRFVPAVSAAVGAVAVNAPQTLTLTMWTTEVFSPLQDDQGGRVMRQQVDEFMAQNPHVGVEFTLKKAYGIGGMADFLRTTGAVVPQSLPDLAIVDIAELPDVARAGLVRPLSGLISPKLQADLFPFAVKSGTVDGQLVGLIFEADVLHLAYNKKLSAPPATWADVLSGTVQYVFAGGGQELEQANDSFWLQYLAGGGTITLAPDTEQPELDAGVLEALFGFYQEGVARGAILKSVLDYKTDGDSWAAYLSGKAALANVSSLRFLSSRSLLPDTGFAPAPTRDGKVATVASGWALVVVAKEPARQEAAARLSEWLLAPERSSAWTRATNRLPATRQALALWDQSDEYTAFVRGLLEAAQPTPGGLQYDAVGKTVERAIRDVIAGGVSPKEAAAKVAGAGG